MANSNSKNGEGSKKQAAISGGLAAAVAAGAVIGAGVAVAATAAMKNEKTRSKIMDAAEKVRSETANRIPQIRKKIEEGKYMDKAEKKLSQVAAGRKKTGSTSSSLQKSSSEESKQGASATN